MLNLQIAAMASPMNDLMNLCQRNPKKHGI